MLALHAHLLQTDHFKSPSYPLRSTMLVPYSFNSVSSTSYSIGYTTNLEAINAAEQTKQIWLAR